MKHQEDHLPSKGVRDLCDAGRSWCAKLEAPFCPSGRSGLLATVARTVARVLGGTEPTLDARGLALLLIHAIRQLIERLLAAEALHHETLATLPPARSRRDTASQELYRRLKAFRLLGMSSRRGPVIPPGALPRQPDQVAAVAAAVRPRLDCQELHAAPGVRILPSLRPSFGLATADLAEASAEVEEALDRSRETRKVRDATKDELRARVTAARSLLKALRDLQALDCGGK